MPDNLRVNIRKSLAAFQKESGITGLETAIILIAFVVVAAVFAYTVLSAGLFSTQKSQEAVYSGMKETQSTLVLKSAVLAVSENTGGQGYISQIRFTLSNILGGEPIDITPPLASGTDGKAPAGSPNKIVISYKDDFQKVDDLFWTVSLSGHHNGDNQLDAGEKAEFIVGNTVAHQNGGNLVDALSTHHLGPDTAFTIEVKTSHGATLTFERNTAPWIDHVMNMDAHSGVNLPDAN
jgi:archaeal flagellin FlaB